MADNPTILITRPEPQASRFATSCSGTFGRSAEIVVSPLMKAQFGGQPIQGENFEAAIFTSETGVIGADKLWQGPRGSAFAVGRRTADAAISLGWSCQSADGDLQSLVQVLADSSFAGPVIWARGEDVAGDLVSIADAHGLEVVSQVVYRQVEQELSAHAVSVLGGSGRVIVPLFSARSARLAEQAVRGSKADIKFVAISAAVADELVDRTQVAIADRPDGDAMLKAIASIFREWTA